MQKPEIENTTYGEMLDMITCLQIDRGVLLPARKRLTYDEAIALR